MVAIVAGSGFSEFFARFGLARNSQIRRRDGIAVARTRAACLEAHVRDAAWSSDAPRVHLRHGKFFRVFRPVSRPSAEPPTASPRRSNAGSPARRRAPRRGHSASRRVGDPHEIAPAPHERRPRPRGLAVGPIGCGWTRIARGGLDAERACGAPCGSRGWRCGRIARGWLRADRARASRGTRAHRRLRGAATLPRRADRLLRRRGAPRWTRSSSTRRSRTRRSRT